MPPGLFSPAAVARLRAITEASLTDLALSGGLASPCRLTARGGGGLALSAALVAEQGSYELSLSYDDPLTLAPGTTVTVHSAPSRVFRVVWTPPLGPQDGHRRYGLTEVR